MFETPELVSIEILKKTEFDASRFPDLIELIEKRWDVDIDLAEFTEAVGTKRGALKNELPDGKIFQGNFAKRITTYLNYVISTQRSYRFIDESVINQYVYDQFYLMDDQKFLYEFYYDADWAAGDYGESTNSCWWTYSDYSRGRVVFRYAMRNKKAFAIRLYDPDTRKAVGRCFGIYYDDSMILFNAYGHGMSVFVEIARSLYPQACHKQIQFDMGHDVYINNDKGYLVEPRSTSRFKGKVDIYAGEVVDGYVADYDLEYDRIVHCFKIGSRYSSGNYNERFMDCPECKMPNYDERESRQWSCAFCGEFLSRHVDMQSRNNTAFLLLNLFFNHCPN